LTNVHYHSFAGDLVVCGEFDRPKAVLLDKPINARAGAKLATGPTE
jgi:hypothetical protein